MELKTLLNLPTLYLPTLSRDGRWLAYYTETLELAVLEIATDQTRYLSLGEAVPTRPLPFVWDHDAQFIYFSRDEHGKENYNIYRIDLATGEIQQLTNADNVGDYVLDVHGNLVLFASNRAGTLNLFSLDLETWNIAQLTDYAYPVMDAQFSPDGTQIAYTANDTDSPRNVDVYIMQYDGEEKRCALRNEIGTQEGFTDWVGHTIAVHSDAGGVRRCGVLNTQTNKVKWLSPRTGNYWSGRFSPDGKYLIAYLNQDAAIQPVFFQLKDAKMITPKLPTGVYYGGQWCNGQEAIFTVEADTLPRQVVRYHLSQRRQTPLVRTANVSPKNFAPHTYITYPSENVQIPSLLYKPRGKGPFPAVVYLHGGPTAQFFRDFDPLAQAFVMHGFMVLMPNIRGSTGYGHAFRDAIVMNWGGPDLEDVVAATEYLKTRPDVDADHIGLYGGSYGGYLVYLAMTKYPTVFAAGAAFNGITDLIQLVQEADPHYAQAVRRYMGDALQHRALWEDRSPIYFAHQLQAPLLMLHAANDPRCPIGQAQRFAEALHAAGKQPQRDFWLEILEDEGHSSAELSARQRVFAQLLDFFQHHLR